MRIKKHPSKNEYLLADSIWVRNLCKNKVPFVNLNPTNTDDFNAFMENEAENKKLTARNITAETLQCEKMIVVSNGYDFHQRHKFLYQFPFKEVSIVATNRALRDWQLINRCEPEHRRAINFFVVNNPYKECLRYLPKDHRYYPPCIASIRTYHEFCSNYTGDVLFYPPTNDKNYNGWKYPGNYFVDDYRNPVCAALSLAWYLKVKKIMLLCCDDSFADHKSGSIKLENGLYCYPQQLLAHKIIDAQFYWLKQKGIKISDFSSGVKYANAEYINSEEHAITFFKDEDG